jgi:hypothetical protein
LETTFPDPLSGDKNSSQEEIFTLIFLPPLEYSSLGFLWIVIPLPNLKPQLRPRRDVTCLRGFRNIITACNFLKFPKSLRISTIR